MTRIIGSSIRKFIVVLIIFFNFFIFAIRTFPLNGGSPKVISVPLNSSLQLVCDDAANIDNNGSKTHRSFLLNDYAWNDIIGNGSSENTVQMTCAVDSTESLRLFIMKVHENDNGNYTCEDSYGNIVETFRVIVSTNSEEKWNHSSKHEKIKRLDALKPCESAVNRLRVWKKNGTVICVQRSVEDVCGLGEVASDEPIKKESKDLMSHLLPPLLTALMAFLVVILLIFGFMFIRRRNKELNELRQLHTELVEQSSPPSAKHLTVTVPSVKPLHERIDELPFNMNYEVRLHRLTIKKVISSGEYGRVYAGELRAKGLSKKTMRVAIKGPKRAAKLKDIRALAEELKLMIAVGVHPNVLCLIGTVTENMKRGGDLYGIVEYTMCDMKTYLNKRKNHFVNELMPKTHQKLRKVSSNTSITSTASRGIAKSLQRLSRKDLTQFDEPNVSTSLLISFAYQIANGMEYLASKMCIHRDLAARNVLVRKNCTIRIADFGQDRQWDYQYLVKSIQYASPFKAMARESISDSRFNEKSDVWSYGILLWELFTLGDDPFKEFETADKLTSFYESGGRLPKPAFMPDDMSSIMSQCWLEDPTDRPTFSMLKKMTESVLRVTNPQLLLTTHNRLMEELMEMRKYAEWRDGPSHSRLSKENSTQSR